MQVRVVFYGGLQRISGTREQVFEFPKSELNLNELSKYLLEKNPDLKPHLKAAVYSIGSKIAGLNQVIHDGDEVGLLPPVSGG